MFDRESGGLAAEKARAEAIEEELFMLENKTIFDMTDEEFERYLATKEYEKRKERGVICLNGTLMQGET